MIITLLCNPCKNIFLQSNEVNGSYYMEKEGLVRAVDFLHQQGFEIDTLVTDRHSQIAKWVRENLKEADHRYDIWHMAKCRLLSLTHNIITVLFTCSAALRKKLEKCAKQKDCELVGEWTKSILNHLYWSAVSTPDGNVEEIMEKWTSVNNHIHNIHRGHGEIFKKCDHPTLRGRRKNKKWFKPRKFLFILMLQYY